MNTNVHDLSRTSCYMDQNRRIRPYSNMGQIVLELRTASENREIEPKNRVGCWCVLLLSSSPPRSVSRSSSPACQAPAPPFFMHPAAQNAKTLGSQLCNTLQHSAILPNH